MDWDVELIIDGQPVSKANSRRLIYMRGRPLIIKSVKALAYLKSLREQVPKYEPLLTGDLEMQCKCVYANRRSDLDPSLIMDGLQGLVYSNDRQIKRMVLEWKLDKKWPRAEVKIRKLPDDWHG